MIYRVYSDIENNDRVERAKSTWNNIKNLENVPIKNSDLNRSIDGLPFLKDLLDKGFEKCKDDEDIILYTNSDISLVRDLTSFPKENFFSVRKNVESFYNYSTEELLQISYEHSVNCDMFGITKKWYEENKRKIPDFIIGSPTWDLCMLILINGIRINNICFHEKHESKWKFETSSPKHLRNKHLFVMFCNLHSIPISQGGRILSKPMVDYMSQNFGFAYLNKPKIITFCTPSHKQLHDLNLTSMKNIFQDNHVIYEIYHEKQFCETSEYHQTGWRITQANKIYSLLNILRKFNQDEQFIFCDADIIHLNSKYMNNISSLLNNYDIDMVAQKSYSQDPYQQFCSGFFAGKVNHKTISFLSNIYQDLINQPDNERTADQYFFNMRSYMVNLIPLDDRYFSPGKITNGKLLQETELVSAAKTQAGSDIFICHANWIKGTQNKILFLKTLLEHSK